MYNLIITDRADELIDERVSYLIRNLSNPQAATHLLDGISGIYDRLPLYRIERKIEETDESFNDGEHIIYVNGADKNDSTELGKLMHDFFCTNADDMHYKELADKVRYFKEDEKGFATMCKVMEDMRNETARKAAEQTKIEMALNIIKDGKLTLEQIAQYTMLAIERVTELAAPKAAQ